MLSRLQRLRLSRSVPDRRELPDQNRQHFLGAGTGAPALHRLQPRGSAPAAPGHKHAREECPRASVPAGRTLDMAGAALTAGPALAQFLFPPDGLEVVVKWELLGELPAEQPGSLRAEVPWILGATDLLRLALSRPAFAELMSRPVPGPPETQAQGRWSGLVSAARRRSSWPIA